MSISSVTARIGEIQAQIAQLQSAVAGGAATATSEAFATTLDAATTTAAARETTATGGTAGADTSTDTTGTVAPTTSQRAVVAEAEEYLGLPYVWGGTSKTTGVDCSGLVQSVYASLGYHLPRLSADQARSGRPISSMAQAQPGDLLAWDNSSRNVGADHIAIYVGDGKMIEAPHTGAKVRLVDVPSTPDYIRRILPDSENGGTTSRAATTASTAGSVAASRASFDLQTLLSSGRSPAGAVSA